VNVITAIVQGWKLLIAQRKAWLLIYCCNLIFALVAIMPIQSWLGKVAGRSVSLTQSIGAFDFTFIGDLLRNYGSGMSSLLSLLCVVVLCYVVLNAFLTGGILQLFVHGRGAFSRARFVFAGLKYFWRLTGLSVLFLIIHGIVLGIFAAIFLTIGINPFQMENDVQFMRIAQFLLLVYGMITLLVLIVHAYAKICLVEAQTQGVMVAIKRSMAFVTRRFISVFLLFVLNLGILVAILFVSGLLKNIFSSSSMGGILLYLLIGQVVIFGRIGVRLLVLSSASRLRHVMPYRRAPAQAGLRQLK
jgi:hypothetical protein